MPAQCPRLASQKSFPWFGKLLAKSRLVLWWVLFILSSITSALPSSLHGDWVGNPAIAEARLIAAVTGTGDLLSLPLGLEFRLAAGWKIYWRTPGEAGLPPTLNLKAADASPIVTNINWPIPKRFNAFGFDNFGYENSVILPIDLTGHGRGRNVQLSGELEALVCANICVPLHGEISITVPYGPALASTGSQAIARFAAMVPRESTGQSIDLRAAWQDKGGLFMRFNTPLNVEDIFIEGVDGVSFKKPRTSGDDIFIPIAGKNVPDLTGRTITATIIAENAFLERQYLISPKIAEVSSSANGWTMVLFALLGGAILNLMPCVLPVLAIKISSLVGSLGQHRQLVRIRFLATTLGIIASFLLLATILAGMRMVGAQIGWGIQFQSPLFLTGMVVVIGIFVLTILDRLILPVPAFAQRLAQRLTQRSVSPSFSRVLIGDFSTGMLATILATPCSAPFVGVAVGFALTGSVVELFGIFLALGIGLAFPWLLIMAVPDMISVLPKPGSWIIWLKRALATLLVGTAFWLISILIVVVGMPIAILISLIIALMMVGLTRKKSNLSGLMLFAGISALSALLLIKPTSLNPDRFTVNPSVDTSSELVWQKWQPGLVNTLVADDKIVFVDVTAAWCLTCKLNKTLVLDKAPVAPYFLQLVDTGKLVLLRADWTRPNDAIAEYLASYQRYGIPFNVIYGSAVPKGVQLNEILTAKDLFAAFGQALDGS